MSMRRLEMAILNEARVVFNNPKLKLKDILEWSTGRVIAQEGEIVTHLPEMRVDVAVEKSHDKRSVRTRKP